MGGVGYCLGITSSRKSSTPVIHSHTTDFEGSVRRIIELLKLVCGISSEFIFTSIQVNLNALIRPHRDRNASVTSITVSLGNFTGGDLVIGGVHHNTYRNAITFDGSEVHFVTPFEGDRFSVVLFPHHRMHEISFEQRSFLEQLGFQLATPILGPSNSSTLGSSTAPCVPVRGEKIFIVEFRALGLCLQLHAWLGRRRKATSTNLIQMFLTSWQRFLAIPSFWEADAQNSGYLPSS